MRQARLGDLVATPAWEHDPSSIGARPVCQVLLYATPAARPATEPSDRPSNIDDDSHEVHALEFRDLGQVRQPRIGDLVAKPAWKHDPSSIGARPVCQVLLYATPAARPATEPSGRPSYIGDDSPEVQALEALDLGQVR